MVCNRGYVSVDGTGLSHILFLGHCQACGKCLFDFDLYLPDVNECLIDNGGCDHLCTNHQGYRTCSCRPGYTLRKGGVTCECK